MIGQTPYLEFDEERTAAETQHILDVMKAGSGCTNSKTRYYKNCKLADSFGKSIFYANRFNRKIFNKSNGSF